MLFLLFAPIKVLILPILFVSAYFALRALQLNNTDIELIDIQKDRNIYVMEEELAYAGKMVFGIR